MTVQQNAAYTVFFLRRYKNTSQLIYGNLQPNFQINLSASYNSPFNTDIGGAILNAVQISSGLQAKNKAQTIQIWQGSEIPLFQLTINLETINDVNKDIRDKILTLMSFIVASEDKTTQMIRAPQMLNYDALINSASKLSENKNKSNPQVKTTSSTPASNEPMPVALADNAGASNNTESTSGGGVMSLISKGISWFPEQLTDSSKAPSEKDDKTDDTQESIADTVQKFADGTVHIRIGNYLDFPSCVITDVSFDVKSIMDYSAGYPQSVEVQLTFKPLMLPTIEDWKKILMHVNDRISQQIAKNQNNGLVGQIIGTVTNAVGEVTDSITSGITGTVKEFGDSAAKKVSEWGESFKGK